MKLPRSFGELRTVNYAVSRGDTDGLALHIGASITEWLAIVMVGVAGQTRRPSTLSEVITHYLCTVSPQCLQFINSHCSYCTNQPPCTSNGGSNLLNIPHYQVHVTRTNFTNNYFMHHS